MRTMFILLVSIFMLFAETKSGFMIIVGGGKSKTDADRFLQKYKNESQLWANFEQSGFPQTMLSDTIDGLNKGFHIAVAGICSEEQTAKLFLEMIKMEMNGVYMRKVKMDSNKVTGIFQSTQFVKSQIIKLRDKVIATVSKQVPTCTTTIEINCDGGYCSGTKKENANGLLTYFENFGGDHSEDESMIYCKNNQFRVYDYWYSRAIYADGHFGMGIEGIDSTESWCYFIDEKPVALSDEYQFFIIGENEFDLKSGNFLNNAKAMKATADSILCSNEK